MEPVNDREWLDDQHADPLRLANSDGLAAGVPARPMDALMTSKERNCQCPGCARKGGCWYGRQEWRQTSERVRVRDRHICRIIEGCQRRATVADHIKPVHPLMTWHEFLAMSGLRAGCHFHNTRRGHVEAYNRELEHGVAVAASRNPFDRTSRFSTAAREHDRALAKSTHTRGKPVVVAGYGRRSVGE